MSHLDGQCQHCGGRHTSLGGWCPVTGRGEFYYPPTYQTTYPQGWACPKCGAVYAPAIAECWRCATREQRRRGAEMTDTTGTDFPICPYCGAIDQDAWELPFDGCDQCETECGGCGKPFTCDREVSVTYTTRATETVTASEVAK